MTTSDTELLFSLVAEERSPVGAVVVSEGTFAGVNPFGFSTKYTDCETKLVYYRYRYLDTGTGRWVSRDPMQENNGDRMPNVLQDLPVDMLEKAEYLLVGNSALNEVDVLGLFGDGKVICDKNCNMKPSCDSFPAITKPCCILHEECHIGQCKGDWDACGFCRMVPTGDKDKQGKPECKCSSGENAELFDWSDMSLQYQSMNHLECLCYMQSINCLVDINKRRDLTGSERTTLREQLEGERDQYSKRDCRRFK